ncbi:unnamed protein product [Schistocephalus solidus]|uniref:Scavenger receptor class B member 1 n=1 Tax=Schistocephalus solidus TaxID=70667 RepID=A0A183SFE3_SCHSO|nr:unnamed protein product [Schistocephalus solidus]
MTQCSPRCSFISLLLGMVVSTLTAIICSAVYYNFDELIQKRLTENIVIKPGSPSLAIMVDESKYSYLRVWLFNLTNPLEVEKSAKPKLKTVGPYVYRWQKLWIHLWCIFDPLERRIVVDWHLEFSEECEVEIRGPEKRVQIAHKKYSIFSDKLWSADGRHTTFTYTEKNVFVFDPKLSVANAFTPPNVQLGTSRFMYSTSVCRSFNFTIRKKVGATNFKEMELYELGPIAETFHSAQDHPSNADFHVNETLGPKNPPSGVFDLSNCLFKKKRRVPIFFSLPYFHKAALEVRNKVDFVGEPQQDLEFTFNIEPDKVANREIVEALHFKLYRLPSILRILLITLISMALILLLFIFVYFLILVAKMDFSLSTLVYRMRNNLYKQEDPPEKWESIDSYKMCNLGGFSGRCLPIAIHVPSSCNIDLMKESAH